MFFRYRKFTTIFKIECEFYERHTSQFFENRLANRFFGTICNIAVLP